MVVNFIFPCSKTENPKVVTKNIDAAAIEVGRAVTLGNNIYYVKHVSLDLDTPALLVNLADERK